MPFPPDDDFFHHDPFADEPADEPADESSGDALPSPFSEAPMREIEQRMNIHRLKAEANEIAGGQMTSRESAEAPPEVLEQFWKNVVAFERAPLVSPRQKLKAAGILVPPGSELDDETLHARLWQIIEFLATQRTYLADTDHLSDRELYAWLRDEALREAMREVPGMNCHTSPIGSCGEEDMQINFRYFADEDSRRSWMEQFPDYEMPERIEPPFHRDHLLPQAVYLPVEPGDDGEWDDEDWEEDEAPKDD